jgi:hypothetical protein
MPVVVPFFIWVDFMAWWCMAFGAGVAPPDGPVESGGGDVCAKAIAGAPSSEAARSVEARSFVFMGISWSIVTRRANR